MNYKNKSKSELIQILEISKDRFKDADGKIIAQQQTIDKLVGALEYYVERLEDFGLRYPMGMKESDVNVAMNARKALAEARG